MGSRITNMILADCKPQVRNKHKFERQGGKNRELFVVIICGNLNVSFFSLVHTFGMFFRAILKLSVSFQWTTVSSSCTLVVTVGQSGFSPW